MSCKYLREKEIGEVLKNLTHMEVELIMKNSIIMNIPKMKTKCCLMKMIIAPVMKKKIQTNMLMVRFT